MNLVEFETYLETHLDVEFCESEDGFVFRAPGLSWYDADEKRAVQVTVDQMNKITPKDLDQALRKGLDLEQMTRITGYFTKITSWNKGKLGELRDRHKGMGGVGTGFFNPNIGINRNQEV